MTVERHAVESISNTLRWLLSDCCDVDRVHPGLRHTLLGARTQIDAALKLLPKEGS